VIDPNMGEDIRITVIATGFERATPRRVMEPQKAGRLEARIPVEQPVPFMVGANSSAHNEFLVQTINTDDLDIRPSFAS